jgi:hypothetical protein
MTRLSILKLSCVFALSMLSASACKKADGPAANSIQPTTPGPNDKIQMEKGDLGPVTKINYSKSDIDSLVNMPGPKPPADARGAMEYWLAMPPRLPLPAHVLAETNIALISQTDTTAQFSTQPAHAPMKLLVTVAKRNNGTASIWLVTRIEEIPSDVKK